jgi:hypothetical protein
MNKILDALRVMKLIICLLIFSFQANAVAFSQSINLAEKNASIESVVKKIASQGGYSLFYNIDLLRKNPSKINLSLKNVTVEKALEETLVNQPLEFVIVNNTVIIKPKPAISENKSVPEIKKPVRGKVTDGKNPLSGVSVKVDGTNLSTVTDFNGNFILDLAPGKYRLVFSSVGYESKRIEKMVSGDSDEVLNVALVPALIQLQEALVVGYSIKKASEITGSLQTFSARQLEGVTTSNLISQLKGKITGMYITEPSGDPNNKASFVVRGQGTLPITDNFMLIFNCSGFQCNQQIDDFKGRSRLHCSFGVNSVTMQPSLVFVIINCSTTLDSIFSKSSAQRFLSVPSRHKMKGNNNGKKYLFKHCFLY